jgi:hypothetical protein
MSTAAQRDDEVGAKLGGIELESRKPNARFGRARSDDARR